MRGCSDRLDSALHSSPVFHSTIYDDIDITLRAKDESVFAFLSPQPRHPRKDERFFALAAVARLP